MPYLERMNPETPCQPEGAHHPHWMICSDPTDECYDDFDDGLGYIQYHEFNCCTCGLTWPCKTKQQHVRERAAAHA